MLWALARSRGHRPAVSLDLRAAFYHAAFPKYPPIHVDGRWLTGAWMMGNNYKGSGYYGAYPPTYLQRIYTLFPDAQQILHVFSGSLQADALRLTHLASMFKVFGKHSPWDEDGWPLQLRFDGSPDFKPDFLGNPNDLADITKQQMPPEYRIFDVAFCDPPYSKPDAVKYGFPLPDAKRVFQQLHKVIKINGWVVWMDTKLPQYRKDQWLHCGNIFIIRSTNHRVRLVSLFKRLP